MALNVSYKLEDVRDRPVLRLTLTFSGMAEVPTSKAMIVSVFRHALTVIENSTEKLTARLPAKKKNKHSRKR